MGTLDPARTQHLAWAALKQGDVPAATRLVRGLGPGADPFLKAATALASGDKKAFQLFEDAYVAVPSGPSNLIATEVLARTGAAVAVARRLVERPDGKGREGAGTLQTHLHYADCFAEAAEVGTVVYAANPPSKAQTAFEVACSWAKATDVDHAIEWLERAADDGFRAASLVDGEPDLAAVRADPRWPLLRARLSMSGPVRDRGRRRKREREDHGCRTAGRSDRRTLARAAPTRRLLLRQRAPAARGAGRDQLRPPRRVRLEAARSSTSTRWRRARRWRSRCTTSPPTSGCRSGCGWPRRGWWSWRGSSCSTRPTCGSASTCGCSSTRTPTCASSAASSGT